MTRSSRTTRLSLALLAVSLAALMAVTLATDAKADLRLEDVSVSLNQPPQTKKELDLEFGSPTFFQEITVPVTKPNGEFVDPLFDRQAGGHPDLALTFKVAAGKDPWPAESVHDLEVELPKGLVGDPNGIPSCPPSLLVSPDVNRSGADCPANTQIGVAELWNRSGDSSIHQLSVGVYNITHGSDVPARFGFNYSKAVGLITPEVKPDKNGEYSISSASFSITQAELVEKVKVTLWGVPADPSHDFLRQSPPGIQINTPTPNTPQPKANWQHLAIEPAAFLTAPPRCPADPLAFKVRGDSWENIGKFDEHILTTDVNGTPFQMEGCSKVPFNPSTSLSTQSHAAAAPTGLDVDITMPQSKDAYSIAQAHLKKVRMTFPKEVSLNASSAAGLGSCSVAQIGIGSNAAPTCPDSAILGSVKIKTPLLSEELEGSVYLAKQSENPFNSLVALYIAVKGPGFWLKLPGKVDLDPSTGQITTTFDNNPQLPFEQLHLELTGGPRAALTTPSGCGTYTAETEFVSWASDTPVIKQLPITVNEGCNSGGFNPKLNAGTANPAAGAYSPFTLQLTRQGSEQNISSLKATLPLGLLAKLGGVPLCGDAQAAAGDCPAASQVGTVTVGAGAGPTPVYVPEAGKAPTAAYLAGPYKGAPYSLVVKVPAQAGPFDLGTVTVRNALRVDPTSTQVTAESDALPQILQGIPVAYRDVRVEVNRPEFTVNPTNCGQRAVTSEIRSSGGQVANPQSPFRAVGCGELGFGPTLALSLKGGMKRSGNPALTATLTAPKGEANIAATQVMLPKTEFIDNAHVNGPCTRVQFNANACPAGSILGTATAYSPLLDKPLSGPVYFRSNGGERELPDLVADLNGQIHVILVGFIDSVKVGKESSRVRTRFQNVPDAPVSKFVLKLKGGKKGLIENSVDLCKTKPKATLKLVGQNGKFSEADQAIQTSCKSGKKAKGGKSKGKSKKAKG
jgi:hypothetical protein